MLNTSLPYNEKRTISKMMIMIVFSTYPSTYSPYMTESHIIYIDREISFFKKPVTTVGFNMTIQIRVSSTLKQYNAETTT